MGRSSEIVGIDVEAERDALIEKTAEWLGRTAALVQTIRTQFPYSQMTSFEKVGPKIDSRKTVSRGFTTPRIVLPAREVSVPYEGGYVKGLRNIAPDLTLVYDQSVLAEHDFKNSLPTEHTPIPSSAYIPLPYAVAKPSEARRDVRYKYRYMDNMSVTGTRLDMFPGICEGYGGELPYTVAFQGDNPMINFNAFKKAPTEALGAHPEVITFHRNEIDKYIDCLGQIAAALFDPELNPQA